MHVAAHVNLVSVADGVVLVAVDARRHHRKRVGWVLIRHDLFNFWAHVFPNGLAERLCACVWNVKKPQVSAAFTDAHYVFFVLLPPALAAYLATDPSLICLDNTLHLCARFWVWRNECTCLHSLADAMPHIPCSAVVHSEMP